MRKYSHGYVKFGTVMAGNAAELNDCVVKACKFWSSDFVFECFICHVFRKMVLTNFLTIRSGP